MAIPGFPESPFSYMPLNLTNIQTLIQGHRRCVLTTHVNPDGDGLGSELALARALQKLGKETSIINHSPTPENYQWMDPDGTIIQFVPERDRDLILNADIIFVVDTNQPDRLRSLSPFVLDSKAVKVIIDHHLEPHPMGNHYFIDDEATSTGEIIYRIVTTLGEGLMDNDIARWIYTAIMTDTGSFRFPRTDSEIHRIAAHLLEFNISPIEVYANVYEGWSQGRMRLLGEVLDSMKTAHDGRLAYVVCTQAMFKATGTSEIETDNFTTYPMSVRGVQVGILINELQNGVKISFRSKGTIPINQLAKEFGGNGHLNAAGARVHETNLEAVVASIVERSKKYLQ
jgi:phosphoesterase RecJ-like protein